MLYYYVNIGLSVLQNTYKHTHKRTSVKFTQKIIQTAQFTCELRNDLDHRDSMPLNSLSSRVQEKLSRQIESLQISRYNLKITYL
jgi:hypothetical protein